ncbi:MAG TPA: SPFH domain-containing protein [Candidatus Thermoplasmatota archaeon]|nr:SPFH domain-containing protein [Candidatus Thermoplasmatota archaeon]
MPTSGTGTTPERQAFALPGVVGLLIVLLFGGAAVACVLLGVAGVPGLVVLGVLLGIAAFLCIGGLFVIQPNQAEVLVFLGRYRGTVHKDGWYWTNPFTSKRKLSLRVQNFNTPTLKVNDADGNPIEIAAVVVWRVADTARASFDVESYGQFVQVQAETAVRHIANEYPYDVGADPRSATLRGSADQVSKTLNAELQSRLDVAGIQVIETRLTHLAYSPEIAGAMLQRQQAAAIIAARQRIATGAVGIVETVLKDLSKNGTIKLSAEEKAQMVTSLLVVLTSDRGAQPVLATAGTP